MNLAIEKISMFAIPHNSNIQIDAFYRESKTKKRERRGAESALFKSMHRIELCGSDLSYLFNPTLFQMPHNEKSTAISRRKPAAISAKSILKELIEFESPKQMRKHLRKLMDSYRLHHPDAPKLEKQSIYATYLMLDQSLKKADKLAIV